MRHLSYRDTSSIIPSSYQKAAWPKVHKFCGITNVRWQFRTQLYETLPDIVRTLRLLWNVDSFEWCGPPFASMRLWWTFCFNASVMTEGRPDLSASWTSVRPVPKHCAPFSDTGRVHNMFAIDCNKSSVNFTGSDVFRLQKPNHASHLTVGGICYRRVHCHNPLHSQREKVRCTNCIR